MAPYRALWLAPVILTSILETSLLAERLQSPPRASDEKRVGGTSSHGSSALHAGSERSAVPNRSACPDLIRKLRSSSFHRELDEQSDSQSAEHAVTTVRRNSGVKHVLAPGKRYVIIGQSAC